VDPEIRRKRPETDCREPSYQRLRDRLNESDQCVYTRVARFFLIHDTQTGKMYQMTSKCTDVHKIFQMAIKYINIIQSKELQN
jgi:hypothetical protein